MIIWLIPILLLIPVIFQFIAGNNESIGSKKIKFWHTCIISIIIQFIMIILSSGLLGMEIERNYYNEGTSAIWVVIFGFVLIMLLYLVIGIQIYANITDNNSNR